MRSFLGVKSVLIFCGFLAAPLIGSASSFVERPFPEIVREADQIVRGKVGKKIAREAMGLDGHRRIYTYYEFEISEAFKGTLKDNDSVSIRELGGEVDGRGMNVPGSAFFDTGEDVVLTIGSKNPDGSYDLRGLATGKFTLDKDEDGKEFLHETGASILTHPAVRPYEASLGINNGENSRHKVSLEELRQLVKSQAEEASRPGDGSKGPNPSPSSSLTSSVKSPSVTSSGGHSGVQLGDSQTASDLQKSKEESDGLFHGTAVLKWVILSFFIGLFCFWVLRKKS